MPKGWNGGTSNLTISYDPGYAQGTLNIVGYRIIDSVKAHNTDLGLGIDSLNNYTIPHTFLLKGSGNAGVGYSKYICEYSSSNPNNIGSGFITITKLDTQNGIISGEFAATLYKAGCDTVTITDGRFDMKLH